MDSDYYGIKYVTLIERRKLLDSGYFIRISPMCPSGCHDIRCGLICPSGTTQRKAVEGHSDKIVNKTEEGGRFLDDYDLIDSGISRMLK